MNDLIYHAKMWLTDGELSQHEADLKLNDIPRWLRSESLVVKVNSVR